MSVGGAAVPRSLIEAFDQYGLTIKQGWGMTETSPIGSFTSIKPDLLDAPADTLYAMRARAGLQIPLVQLRIVDDEGRRCPGTAWRPGSCSAAVPGSRAAITTSRPIRRSSPPMAGCAPATSRTIDAEGYVRIADRTKDLIKSGGEWISSVELENAIMGHPAVAEAAVIAVKHPKWDERPLAVVVKKPGKEVTPQELRDFCSRTSPSGRCRTISPSSRPCRAPRPASS